MKLHHTGTPVEVQGQLAQGSFGIKQSPKAFQILSSGLYSNKPMAIVRELSANAADAHVLNKNTKKAFEVKIPNRLDNQFYIKDFGPGLSHDQVMHLYTTYFDSTKSESNDFIGGLGLGSKSPFSYTDSFTVESRQKGFKRTYSAFVGENGIPQIVQLGEAMATKDPDGLTVGFPVNPSDYKAFEREAQRILPWFTPTPTLLGGTLEARPTSLRSSQGLDIYGHIPVWEEPNSWRNGSTFVRMGNVLYPLSWEDADLEDDRGFSLVLRNHGARSYVFDVKIGELEVAASREGLQYDRTTKTNLKRIANGFMATVGDTIEREINEVNQKCDRFEAQEQIHQMEKDWGFSFKDALPFLEKAAGKKYPNIKKAAFITLPANDFKTFTLVHMSSMKRTASPIKDGKIKVDSRYSSGSGNTQPVSIVPGSPTMVTQCDTKGYVVGTYKLLQEKPSEAYFKDHSRYSQGIIIVPNDIKKVDDPAFIAERDTFLKAIGTPPLHKTSEYQAVARARGTAAVAKEEIETYDIGDYRRYDRSSMSKKVVQSDSMDYWFPYNAQTQTVTMGLYKDGTPICLALDSFMQGYEILAEKALLAKKVVPDVVLGIPTKHEARAAKAGQPQMGEWIKDMLLDPEVQKQFLAQKPVLTTPSNHNVDWHIRSSAMEVLTAVRLNQASFSKLGKNWATLAAATTDKLPHTALAEVFEPLLKEYQVELGGPSTTIDAYATYSKLLKKMPMLAATMGMLTDDAQKKVKTSVMDDIKFFLDAKGNPDIELSFVKP